MNAFRFVPRLLNAMRSHATVSSVERANTAHARP